MNPIVPRDPDVDFAQLPRRWLAGSAAATAIANGINLLFPHGERYFVRAVMQFRDRITDPQLAAAIKGFIGQEGRHSRVHDDFNQVLREQGFEIDGFLSGYKRLIAWFEKHAPDELNLAITAAAEHFTATLAEGAFTRDLLDNAAPAMREMLAWHAAEEIEHKAVAFDVLQAVAPSYALRMAGLFFATAIIGGLWFLGASMLMQQDHRGRNARRDHAPVARDPIGPTEMGLRDLALRVRDIVSLVFARGIRQYISRDFHPDHNANDQLATEWFAARGMSLPNAAARAV